MDAGDGGDRAGGAEQVEIRRIPRRRGLCRKRRQRLAAIGDHALELLAPDLDASIALRHRDDADRQRGDFVHDRRRLRLVRSV